MGKAGHMEVSGATAIVSLGVWHRLKFLRREARRIFRTALSEFFADNIPNVAAAITFYVLLALFPAITAFVSLYGLFASVAEAQAHLAWLQGILPSRGLDVIGQDMIRIAAQRAPKLGLAFIAGLAVSLWSAKAGAESLIEGLNAAYEEKETRGYLGVLARAFAFTLAALVLSLAVFASAALPFFAHAFPPHVAMVLDALRWIALVGVAFVSLIVVYRFGPAGKRAAWSGVIPGALLAMVLWIAVSALYSIYVADVANYDRTYGPLGAVVGFLMWIWLSLIVVLFGAELNAAMEQHLSRET